MGRLCYGVQLTLHRFAWAGFPLVVDMAAGNDEKERMNINE
jgi:hypothetical protein